MHMHGGITIASGFPSLQAPAVPVATGHPGYLYILQDTIVLMPCETRIAILMGRRKIEFEGGRAAE